MSPMVRLHHHVLHQEVWDQQIGLTIVIVFKLMALMSTNDTPIASLDHENINFPQNSDALYYSKASGLKK